MIPEKLGPYRLGRRLGRGGMGAVYEGLNEETGDRAAVKVLSGQFSHEEDFRQRFASEIETLRRLRHPNIVRLFGFGQQDDQLFYAMELVDGISLEEELRQGRRFHWQEVLRIARQTCDALRHAHDRGVIHRDIKPANLLLAEDETIKLSDFGIAKMFGHSQQTAIGSVIGTVEYMAPEQADARPVDARSDLYSLGGVLYALLAGRAPLVADSLPEMLRKQRHEPPEPLDRLVSGVPAAVVKLIHQLLEKDPNRRIPNARSLARQLDALSFVLAGGPGDGDGRRADEEGETQDEFVVNSEAASAGVVDPLGMMPTRAMEDEDDGDSLSEAAPEEVSPATMATDAFELAPSAATDVAGEKERDAAAATSSSEGTKSATRFTPVGEEELDPTPPPEEQEHPLISIQTWVLVACLLAVGATLYYFYLPPSPDALYERIMAKTTGETIDHAARDDIEQFLQRYSDDPRCRRLRGLQRQLTLDRLERQFDRQVKRLEDTSDLLPIQRAYLEARNSLRIDPERGMAKLKAIIDLYSHEADTSGPTGECLELARRRLERLREESDGINKEMTELVDSRLEMADTLCETRPEEAKEMYEAVIELYSTKPWAGPAVRRARESLQAMDEQPQEMNSP